MSVITPTQSVTTLEPNKRQAVQPASNAIEIKHLDFYYGSQKTLKNINFEIKKNKITALIGSSGSGKSTLLRTLNLIYRLYPEQKAYGEIWFNQKNLLNQPVDLSKLRSEIGMVFQKPTPFPMSIFENIAFAIRLHENVNKKELKIRVERALRQAALWHEVKDKLHQNAANLSGGQQQRLCIARTIAINPEVVLLDEPTAALDPISTQKIEHLIRELSQHYTVVIVTHNMAQAKRLTDYTAYLNQGKLVEYRETAEFFDSPQDPRSQAYIARAD